MSTLDERKTLRPTMEPTTPDWQALAQRRQRRPRRLGGWLLLLGFAGFLTWAALAPLDNGVAVPATVVVSGNRQAVEHPTGGVVERLWVREGDSVTRGQTLVSLDATRLRSEADTLNVQHGAAFAEAARLEAERDGHERIEYPEWLASTADVELLTVLELQRQLFASRRAALRSELGGIEANLAGQRSLASGLESSLVQKRIRLEMLGEQRDNLRELASEGYIPRNRLLEVEGSYAQLQSDIAADIGTLEQTRRQIDELQLRTTQRRDEYQREVRDALAQARLRGQELAGRLATTRFDLAHTQLRAPMSGIVVGLALHTEGGVVQPGALLMEIVPEGEPLLVEGQLPVEQVDRVHAGLPVELMFTAFERSRTPRVSGEVTQVSADRLVDERSGLPYYRVYVEVAAEDLQVLGSEPLRAGMPVEAFVRTGERTLLNYLFKPLMDRARTAWGDA
ncbi:HlyD family type I secretion periplasmic adaptor subunit [Billgrantia endophytica]|uniref:Membrane fusion protein (MFP) family protein n=1 Tax=Billgrantia endophytica TaxID=2033802 RepID=A0A2N7TXD6_9GAMM|nr:HlyD family type I secretion periplasmic adaptor subunit [Halomonas endophytica]PMR72842.1 hemolysin D [Halomonas endophytica]